MLVEVYRRAAEAREDEYPFLFSQEVEDLSREAFLEIARRVGLAVKGNKNCVRNAVLCRVWGHWNETRETRREAGRRRREEEERRREEEWERKLEELCHGRLRPQQEFHNALAVLGLRAPVSADDLRSAYRKLALQHHPDRGGVAAVFVRVTDAYNLARTFLKETRP
jgi:hypothetical protein